MRLSYALALRRQHLARHVLVPKPLEELTRGILSVVEIVELGRRGHAVDRSASATHRNLWWSWMLDIVVGLMPHSRSRLTTTNM